MDELNEKEKISKRYKKAKENKNQTKKKESVRWKTMTDETIAEKTRILTCQLEYKNTKYSKPCLTCNDRFKCHTMVAKEFVMTEMYSGWKDHYIVAETKEEAQNWFDKLGFELFEEYGEYNRLGDEYGENTEWKEIDYR